MRMQVEVVDLFIVVSRTTLKTEADRLFANLTRAKKLL